MQKIRLACPMIRKQRLSARICNLIRFCGNENGCQQIFITLRIRSLSTRNIAAILKYFIVWPRECASHRLVKFTPSTALITLMEKRKTKKRQGQFDSPGYLAIRQNGGFDTLVLDAEDWNFKATRVWFSCSIAKAQALDALMRRTRTTSEFLFGGALN